MTSADPGGAVAFARPWPRARVSQAETIDAASAAWILALPCAALTIALIALLGPPLSHLVYPTTVAVLPTVDAHPEPVEGTRYLLSLLGPVLLAVSIVVAAPRLRIGPRAALVLAVGVQLAGLAVVVTCFAYQHSSVWQIAFFPLAQLAGAAVAAVAIAVAARRGWLSGWRPERAATRFAVPALVVVVTGIWFLSYLNTAETACWYGDCYNTAFQVDETFAVLNGLTPLVDHTAAYGSLWPFVFAALMSLLGKTLLVYTFLMWGLTVAILLAIYGVLRRVTHSSLGALALYLPLMAFTFFGASRDPGNPIAIYQQVPLRNAAPFLIAWLVARRLDRGRGATWVLGLACGLAVINNVDFGVAALGATCAALVWTQLPLSSRALGRLAAPIALGLLGALALVAALTLIRAGSLPDLTRATMFARIYGIGGVGVSPLPHILGFPLVAYLTYTAAIAVATVRAVRRAPNTTLTGMLVWSGVFGFGSGAYYVGASVPMGVPTLFPAWALAVALLTVVVVRHVATHRDRLPDVAVLTTLCAFALIASFLVRPPARLAPWEQARRLTTEMPVAEMALSQPLAPPATAGFRGFVGEILDDQGRLTAEPGAPVAFFTGTGHLLADAYGLRDVVPYTGESVFTEQQFDDAIGRLRAAGGNTLLIPTWVLERVTGLLYERDFQVLTTRGFRAGVPGVDIPPEQVVVADGLTKWADGSALRPG